MLEQTLQVPKGDVDASQGTHEDRTPSIEASPPRQLPYVLDIISFEASDTVEPGVQAALDGLSMTLQRSLAPADVASIVCDLDEEPAWRHAEVLHGSYLPHVDCAVRSVWMGGVDEMRWGPKIACTKSHPRSSTTCVSPRYLKMTTSFVVRCEIASSSSQLVRPAVLDDGTRDVLTVVTSGKSHAP